MISVRNVLGSPLAMIAALKLRKASFRCNTIEEQVKLVYSFRVGSLNIKPLQVRKEIVELLRLLQEFRPSVVCEIGTSRGGTLFLFSKVSSLDATIVSMDLPAGPFGGGYAGWRTPLYKSLGWGRQKIHLIRGDSHDSGTIFRLKRILGKRKIEFLFIDGDHTYEGVRRDFEMYKKMVRPGTIIAFHDIVSGPPENVGGVPKFWNENKQAFNFVEIVEDWEQGGCGIGVIFT